MIRMVKSNTKKDLKSSKNQRILSSVVFQITIYLDTQKLSEAPGEHVIVLWMEDYERSPYLLNRF